MGLVPVCREGRLSRRVGDTGLRSGEGVPPKVVAMEVGAAECCDPISDAVSNCAFGGSAGKTLRLVLGQKPGVMGGSMGRGGYRLCGWEAPPKYHSPMHSLFWFPSVNLLLAKIHFQVSNMRLWEFMLYLVIEGPKGAGTRGVRNQTNI